MNRVAEMAVLLSPASPAQPGLRASMVCGAPACDARESQGQKDQQLKNIA